MRSASYKRLEIVITVSVLVLGAVYSGRATETHKLIARSCTCVARAQFLKLARLFILDARRHGLNESHIGLKLLEVE